MMWRPPAGALLGLCALNRNRRLVLARASSAEQKRPSFQIWRFRLDDNGPRGLSSLSWGNEALRRRLLRRCSVRGRRGQRPNQPRQSFYGRC
ncbi:hypothetical protein PR003_g21820 [Phytophthora rubi]|uniref:Uncharacterized protein n=1 Tax=Phytophthora rubi TaxID=129364 RepID=A0A6A3I0Y5_9STRA|nr:hypothetical protein PR002_g26130 [Phytophthora rubi]KAE8975061.1 hypothetical protein PR001_g25819 [Phytophthora rubi]KAE9304144.1 hypothetical protein PR003_g21820 [Phytophthora rubi]